MTEEKDQRIVVADEVLQEVLDKFYTDCHYEFFDMSSYDRRLVKDVQVVAEEAIRRAYDAGKASGESPTIGMHRLTVLKGFFDVFDDGQMRQIQWGLEAGIDVSKYTVLDGAGKPVFDWMQMDEICWGLEQGIDVSKYTQLDENGKPVFDADQMAEIRWGLEAGIDVSAYADPGLDWMLMREKRLGLERKDIDDLS